MKNLLRATIAMIALLPMVPGIAAAQGLGSIAGVARDTSGAVLPGVTVETSSPALIEKTRTVVSDGQGLYRFVDLRPGVYSVVFTLTGFNSVRRDGIELTANFTATVNAEMRVGALEETITVSGATPMVDVRNVVAQKVFTRDVIDAVPRSTGFNSYGLLIPGMVTNNTSLGQDVGGTGDRGNSMGIHGSRPTEMQPNFDGMSVTNGVARGSYGYYPNNGAVQETVVEGDNMDAEHEFSGVVSNLVPKEGGNGFKGFFFTNFTNNHLQSVNLSDDLIAQGLKAANRVKKYWDFNPGFGGPLMKDKLWFYSSYRHWGTQNYIAGLFVNPTPLALLPPCSGAPAVPGCTPSGPQASENIYHYSITLRPTWQLSPRNKITVYGEHQYSLWGGGYGPTALQSPEAAVYAHHNPQYLAQATWSAPVTNKLLLQLAGSLAKNNPQRYRQPGVPDDISAITELSNGFFYRAQPGLTVGAGYGIYNSNNYTYKGSVSYVTGTHSFKTGFLVTYDWDHQGHVVNNSLNFQFRNGKPSALQEWATPLDFYEKLVDSDLFAQDTWTLKKVTLNLGLRMDHVVAWVIPQEEAAGRFVPARSYPKVPDVPNFTSLSPRLGFSYDVFGNSKTALKASLGRYTEAISTTTLARSVNPLQASVFSVTRTWTDNNNDYIPDCVLTNPLTNGECGQINDLNFGNANKITTSYDPSAIKGFNHQGFNWETSVSVQHEIVPRVSVNAGFFRRWYGNFRVTQNVAVSPSNFGTFCVTAPIDARLPGGGGNEICGYPDVNPDKFGQVTNLITNPTVFGKQQEIYDGFDFSANARLGRGVVVSGGMSEGRQRTNNCNVLTRPDVSFPGVLSSIAPRIDAYCDIRPPFQPQVKGLVVYPLPWAGLQTSMTIQSLPGPQVSAQYVVTSAQVFNSLGRNLAAGAAATAIVDLIPPGTRYDPRYNQVDLRVSKSVKIGKVRIQGMFDLYNLFNANPVLALNTRYGASWQAPTYILPGRLAKFGAQLDF